MDRLSDALPTPTVKPAVCPEHGAFESRNIIRNVWSKCPACEERRIADEAVAAAAEARRQAEAHHASMLASAAIPARFIGRSFENFKATTDEQRAALTIARNYVEDFPESSRRGLGLVFSGLPGTGKSHLAAAILQALLSPAVRYVTCMDLIRAVRDTWRRDSERSEVEVLRYLAELDLLVIDEIGAQYGTEGEQQIIFDILDRRYREMRPVVLLTNQGKDGLKKYLGDRSYDRLTETSRWVAFDWSSYRATARKEAA